MFHKHTKNKAFGREHLLNAEALSEQMLKGF
jgi:hypothetical protein